MKLIKNGTIINEGRSFVGDLLLDGEFIKEIYEGEAPRGNYDEVIDASGMIMFTSVSRDLRRRLTSRAKAALLPLVV